jgi:hypothetical protein
MKKEVTVALYGGLGNQLFQYATGLAVAKHNEAKLIIDLSWFDVAHKIPNTTIRKFALAPFGIEAEIQKKRGFFTLNESNTLKRIFNRISRQFGIRLKSRQVVNEQNFRFEPSIFQLNCPITLNGYWQSPKYFDNIIAEIQGIFGSARALSPESRLVMTEILNSESICAHVRRGDYVTSKQAAKTHGLCDLEYYRKGIRIVSEGMTNPHCYVFSDDPEWVRENFDVGVPITVVDVNGPDDAHQDLWLMAACQRFVIANSSLSWWGAYLSNAQKKIVVAPKKWFAEKKYDTTDLIPADWRRI